jgi:hypothetical protein
MAKEPTQPPLPQPREADASQKKIERALEIREASSKAREGKPLVFPTRRSRS